MDFGQGINYTFGRYLKDRIMGILIKSLIMLFFFPLAHALKIKLSFVIIVLILLCVVDISVYIVDFIRRKEFYMEYTNCLDKLDQKYLITSMDIKPNSLESMILMESLGDIDKSMLEKIREVEKASNEFKEYLEMWIHEVKLPLSALKLMNYNGTNDIKKQGIYIEKINDYVEQILFYARADAAEKDYLMKKVNLEMVVNSYVKENKDLLIGNHVKIEKSNLDEIIVTDSKWLTFMIGQIVANCLKYKSDKRNLVISFEAKLTETEKGNEVAFSIRDNGIGINRADLPRVFDKSFTGANGRNGSNSTGMGLYIVKGLCDKLGHKIEIESREDEYTEVCIIFGDNRFYNVV